MTLRHVIEPDIVYFLAAIFAGIIIAFYFNHKPNNHYSFSLPVMQNQNNTASINPTPSISFTPKTEIFSQISPDGSKTLTMKITTNKDNGKTYTFITSDSANLSQNSIYSVTLSNSENMSIPFNTWSPDNMYVFLQHNTSSGSGAFVFKADGQMVTETEKYLDVLALFTAKNTGNTYQTTTGWASETLLIVNTIQKDGSKGSSYWFEVPSKAIIQLSTEF